MGCSGEPEIACVALLRYHGNLDHHQLPPDLRPNDYVPKANSLRNPKEDALFLHSLRRRISFTYPQVGDAQWRAYIFCLWDFVALVYSGLNLLLLLHDGEDRDNEV